MQVPDGAEKFVPPPDLAELAGQSAGSFVGAVAENPSLAIAVKRMQVAWHDVVQGMRDAGLSPVLALGVAFGMIAGELPMEWPDRPSR